MSGDPSYTSKNYEKQGGDTYVVGGKLQVVAGGQMVGDDETQHPDIADVAGGATVDAEARTALNGVLAALRNLGILASS